ncbi:MAG: PSD1 and planctomycete cytochrome C domain-containing protein [Pirellulales bacterium]
MARTFYCLLWFFCVTTAARGGELPTTVAAIFERRCIQCHAGTEPKGGLSLETRRQALVGGDSGPVLGLGDADGSLLIEYVSGEKPQMPEDGEPLTADEVAVLGAWIQSGAPWPEDRVLVDRRFDGSEWWSLKPLQRPAVPEIDSDWPRTPVDQFALQKMHELKLTPSPEADRRTLIRRLTFDLWGLPPTPEEVADFVADTNLDAYERLVDRLLASPRYGERWGRHWLDVVHFGESHGYDKDKTRPNAWPYRDYVIHALNDDKPYSRFVQEQIAGDVLWPDNPQAAVATGFVVAGPWDFVGHVELREDTVAKAITRSLDRDDMLMTTMSTFLSLTVHCARCHDHKFDPIRQRDYYHLQAVFAGVERGDRPIAGTNGDAAEQQVYAVKSIAPRPVHLLVRGEVTSPHELMPPRAVECVQGLPPELAVDDPNNEGRRRAAFARWLTDPRNGLLRRSIVNRVWHYHFGQGLCATPNDFGRMGAVPTHPELLDWLAAEFSDTGESLKRLHKLIVASAVYRQESTADPEREAIDASAQYLWRFPRRRLDAEAVRDAMLAVSGQLDLTMGGPSVQQFVFKDDHSPVYDYAGFAADDVANRRRSVYRFLVRSVPDPFMDCLDCADSSQLVAKRNTTLTALQALAMLNNKLVLHLSERFAHRLAELSDDPHEQINHAFQLAYGRDATDAERSSLMKYIEQHGLAGAGRVIFNSNEFVFVD